MDFITITLETLSQSIVSGAISFQFKTNDLPAVNKFKTDIRKDPHFTEMFNYLHKVSDHAVYWFSLETIDECQKMNQYLDSKRSLLKEQGRLVPAGNKNLDSAILYVGRRRGGLRKRDPLTNIEGRIVQHLGYYKKGSTQGLQLVHWAKDLNFKMTLSVVEFDQLPNAYLDIMELLVAHDLRPLCGRH